MIIRIVKMSFENEKIDNFLSVFSESKSKIRAYEGCLSLKLLRDDNNKNVFFTLSKWENTESLENYRNSELFKTTWSRTKILFNDKPQAWSTKLI
ncbi:MAG: putative quinol monooxygenase [Saprospiraceae bacterium]